MTIERFIPNSFQISNAFVDEMMGELSGNAVKCYLIIVRKTRGWGKESDAIAIGQFIDGKKLKDGQGGLGRIISRRGGWQDGF